MANCMAEEIEQVASRIRDIDECSLPRRITPHERVIPILLSEAETLKTDFSGTYRVLFVRQLYKALQLDEHQQLKWRLEHKLVQALILNHYLPVSVPVTRGLARQIHAYGRGSLRERLHQEFSNGFYIKSALGHSSGDLGVSDMSDELLSAIEAGEMVEGDHLHILNEQWVVQERIPIETEYRVHSFEDRVIEDQTFRRYGKGDIPGERDVPNAYMQSLLDRLPSALIRSSLCGWDIALTTEGKFIVIEANFSGFHQVFRRGFQCSGYFQDPDWGAKSIASLVQFIEKGYDLTITIGLDTEAESEESRFYSDIIQWKQNLANRV